MSTGTRPGLRTSPRRGDRHATHRGQRHDDARRATRRVQPPSVPEVRGPCQWPPLAQRRVESGADRDGQTTMISVLGVPLKGRRDTHVRVGHAVTVGTHSRRRRTATRLRRLTRRGFAVHAILYSLLCLTTTAPRVGDPRARKRSLPPPSPSSRPTSSVCLRSFASAKSAFAYGAAARRCVTG